LEKREKLFPPPKIISNFILFGKVSIAKKIGKHELKIHYFFHFMKKISLFNFLRKKNFVKRG